MYLPDSEERRFVLRLLDYWQMMRGDREFPSPSMINFLEMGKDAASIALVELRTRPDNAILRHVGLRLKPEDWGASVGRAVCEVPEGTVLRQLFRDLPQVIDRPVPLSLGGAFDVQMGTVLGRSILLPLSTTGVQITHVLGGINYRLDQRIDTGYAA